LQIGGALISLGIKAMIMAAGQHPSSTVRTPAPHLIRRFEPRHLGARTIGYHLQQGYSLCICCKDCRRLVEWTPYDLEEKFGKWPDLKLVDLLPRLACKGEKGCGSDDVALFPHLYDGAWRWPPKAQD
jgi:hypothetical protein